MKTKTKKTEITFDAATLLARVEGFAAGQEPLRQHKVKLPSPVKGMPTKELCVIRK
jgi:hypothetical protein